jgi:transposase
VGDREHRRLRRRPDPILSANHEQVVELDRSTRTARRHGAKSDPIDATRAAREVLGRDRLAQPRAAGQRAALAVRLAARRSAVQATTDAQRQLHALVVTAPETAFAMLGGAAPIPASSGQTVRVRLNRSGDRHLNQALHLIVLTRLRYAPATRAYAQRRRAQGKTNREIRRRLVRYVARQLYRLLDAQPAL